MSRTSRRTIALLLAAIALATFLAYLPVKDAGFVMDDVPIVRDNPVVARGTIATIFRVGYWGVVAGGESGLYRPVTTLSFRMQSGADGKVDPAPAHLANLALHVAASMVLALLVLRLGGDLLAAALAGLLFGVHPVHVSVVSGLVGRAEILATLFTVAALHLHTWTAPWPGDGRAPAWRPRAAAWGAALCFFLAMGAKEAAITAPALLVWIDLLYRPAPRGGRVLWLVDRLGSYAPAALATVVYLVLRTLATEAVPGVPRVFQWQNPLVAYDPATRFATALGLVARYLRLLVVPARLSADYSGAAVIGRDSFLSLGPIVGAGTLLVLAAIAIHPLVTRRSGRKLGPAALVASVGAALFLVTYLVISNLVLLIGVGMAERLIYLPSAGFLVVAGGAAFFVVRHYPALRRPFAIAIAAVTIVFGVLTFRAARDWHDEDSVWNAMVRSIPESPLGHHMIGQRLAREGRLDEAMAQFDAVLRTNPDSPSDLYEKAVLYARKGDLASAEPLYRRSVHLDPWYGPAQADFGIVLHRLGKTEEAERRLRYAARWFPEMEKPASELAQLLDESGRAAEAIPYYRRAVRLGRADLAARLATLEAGRPQG